MSSAEETDQAIEIWRYRKLLNMLAQSRGAGTSCITLILPPRSQISQAASMLTTEYGTASNIKSRVNRLSVLSAITSTQQKLKLFNRVPDNGLCVFVGTVLNEEGKEKKISFALTPFKPINTSLYMCDSRFHVEALEELLENDSKWGFIVIDGNGSLFGTLAGNTREVVHKFTVDLPKKHGRGGQSALRFSRLREEARRNYVRKVAELAVQHFITNDRVNVAGLVLAGSAELKTDLSGSDLFDPRLLAKVVKVVDVSYGGENGFNQAIELAADSLANVKFVQEKRLIQKYFDEIALDTGKYCFGINDTLKALDMGAVETLIVWEALDTIRNTLRNAAGEEIIVHSTPGDKDREKFMDKSTGLEMEQAAEPQPLLEWFAEKYKEFGATLEFVTNKSQEGSQFVKGFGGIGGILRYKVAFEDLGDLEGEEDEFYGSDDDSAYYSAKMGERKVINKYYPPDFDPSKIKRRKMGKQVQQPVRLMAPFSMQCNKCGEYVYKGKKFNARKETAEGEEYYGIKVFRFYIKCPTCSSEITFKTDPKNADYICEQGATRNFENWNETKDPTGRTNALPGAEADDEYDSDGNLREEAKERDAMADLERAQEQSRREMEMMDELSDLRQRNARMEQSNVNADPTALLAALHAERETAEQEERRRMEEAEDDAEVAKFFSKIAAPAMPNGAVNGKDKGKGREQVKLDAADEAVVDDGTPATPPDDDENDEESTALPGLTIKRRAAPGLGGPSEPSVASLLAAKGRVLDPVARGAAANGSKPAAAPQQIKRKREGMQKLLGIKKKTKV